MALELAVAWLLQFVWNSVMRASGLPLLTLAVRASLATLIGRQSSWLPIHIGLLVMLFAYVFTSPPEMVMVELMVVFGSTLLVMLDRSWS